MTVVTKSEFAARRRVQPCAVSNWIKRGKLSGAALTADGRINVEMADAQLGVTVDPVMRASRPSAEVVPFGASADLLRARADEAMVRAERMRRDLEAERGKYMLAASAEAAWTATLAAFMVDVEGALLDLSERLDGLDARQRLLTIRKWWRGQRAAAAERYRAIAAAEPEFVPDPERARGV